MRVAIATLLLVSAWPFLGFVTNTFAQDNNQRVAARTANGGNAADQKFNLILFWKEKNVASQQMADALNQAVTQRSDRVTWSTVNVTDPANQAIVERYKVSRAPMPMVLCVAPNGAVTGGIQNKITDKDLQRVLVTPTMTECMKALQEGRLVLVHVRSEDGAPLPSGAAEFAADPSFNSRTTMVSFVRDDPNEARFLSDMDINPAKLNGSLVSLLAPPGVLVGKYPATASKDQIATDLHAAGKCCNDPNCVHNKKGK